VSDRFDWDRPDAGDESDKGTTEPGRESPGGWPEDDPDAGRKAAGGWPDDEPEPSREDPSGWPDPGSPWQQPDHGEYRDFGYDRREESASARAAADPYAGRRSRDPLARLFPGLPRSVRVTLDWILTIVGAILIVLALKEWVVNPYRIPSSSMEPALNCAKPGAGCLGNSSDRVLACRICLHFGNPSRGDIVVFNTPGKAAAECGEGGTFVKRLIGLPGDKVKEDDKGFIWIRGPGSNTWTKLNEPYIQAARRKQDVQTHPDFRNKVWSVPPDEYFFMGDNRAESCDSRTWGSVPRKKLIGIVFFVYWPPDRIGFR
jgi:signal peptidase I